MSNRNKIWFKMWIKESTKIREWAIKHIEPSNHNEHWVGETKQWAIFISEDLEYIVLRIAKDNPMFSIAALTFNSPDIKILPAE